MHENNNINVDDMHAQVSFRLEHVFWFSLVFSISLIMWLTFSMSIVQRINFAFFAFNAVNEYKYQLHHMHLLTKMDQMHVITIKISKHFLSSKDLLHSLRYCNVWLSLKHFSVYCVCSASWINFKIFKIGFWHYTRCVL